MLGLKKIYSVFEFIELGKGDHCQTPGLVLMDNFDSRKKLKKFKKEQAKNGGPMFFVLKGYRP